MALHHDDKASRRPLVDPVLLALRSRRVIVALVALVGGLLAIAVPEVAAVRGELLTLILALALAVIGGYSLEDAAAAARRDLPPPAELEALIREVVGAVVDALLPRADDEAEG
ncbi:MAG: hypothetical protein ACOCXZ_03065 [Chloroflexota bacterium]